MVRSTKPPDEPRIWALRDRSIVTPMQVFSRAMRKAPTDAEKKLWWHLRHRLPMTGTHFRRQVRIVRYIVDFASHKSKLAIEIDGSQHAEQAEADAERTRFLKAEGYRVLRFWNNEVPTNIDGVLEAITALSRRPPPPTPPHKGEGSATAVPDNNA
jgi:very-short-patch-repair endonuclease